MTAVKKEVDEDNYTTYFDYVASDNDVVRKTVEPEGKITYYQYVDSNNTQAVPSARQATQYRYDQSGAGFVANVRRVQDALSNTTYHEYNSRDRIKRTIQPNGNVTYYEYNSGDALSKQISASNGANTQFAYNSNNQDLHKLVGPRNVAGSFPVVSYYDYNSTSDRITTTDALGSIVRWGRDSAGRVRKVQDARSNTTYFNLNSSTGNLDNVRDAGANVAYYKYNAYRATTRMVSPRWPESNYAAFTTYHEYDALDRRTKTIDAKNGTTYFAYTGRGDDRKLVNSLGTQAYFAYDGLRLLSRRSTRDSAGALLQVQYFTYDTYKNRTKVRDPNSNWTYYFYDSLDRATIVRDPLANPVYFAFDNVGNRRKTRDARFNTTYYNYSSLSQLRSRQDALGNSTYYFYDLAGNTTQVRDARLNTAYFFYDALDRTKATRDALARCSYFFYDANGNRTRRRSPAGYSTYFAYDALNRVTKFSQELASYGLQPYGNSPYGRLSLATYFYYDAAGNPTRVLDPRFNPAYFYYDVLNRPTVGRNPLANSTYFFYDANSNVSRVRNARANTSYFYYDALDRPSVRRNALANAIYFSYDANGNATRVRNARFNTAYYFYDALDRLKVARDPLANAGYFFYDSVSNLNRSRSPRGFNAYFYYDALNRMQRVRDAEGGAAYFGYDATGNMRKTTDALWRSAYFSYDALNRISSATDALGQTASFGYDADGNRRKEADALSRSSYYLYDAAGRLNRETDALARTAYFEYDAASNLRKTRDRAGTTTYFTYDSANRRTRIGYPSATQYFEYDAVSNLSKTIDAWGTSNRTYDALNRLTRRNTPHGDNVYYAYNEVSNLKKMFYSTGVSACYYYYDAAERLTQLTTPSNASTYFAYDASANVTKKVLGNGTVSWASFDNADRMNKLRYTLSDGTPIVYFDYGRDIAGRITKIQRENNRVIYYTYDGTDRLIGESWKKKSDLSQIYAFTYSYDSANNRLRMRRERTAGVEWDSAYFAYAADNSLTRRRIFTPPSTNVSAYYYYDANGSLSRFLESGNATYFAYGPHKLITSIKPPSEAATYFYYDARKTRYLINQSGTQTYYLWNGPDLLRAYQPTANGFIDKVYTNSPTRLPAIGTVVEERVLTDVSGIQTTVSNYLHMDHRGTVQATSDNLAAPPNVTMRGALDAFGVPLQAGSADFSYQTNWLTLQVGGKWYGLSKYRLYDPQVGAFTQRDLLGSVVGLNQYRYSKNNPVELADPLGLKDCDKKSSACSGNTGGGGSKAAAAKSEREKLERAVALLQKWAKTVQESCCQDLKLLRAIQEALETLQRELGRNQYEEARRSGRLGGVHEVPWRRAVQGSIDAARGIGDRLTAGGTRRAREAIWGDEGTVREKEAYAGGQVAGAVIESILTGGLKSAAQQGSKLALWGYRGLQAQRAAQAASSAYAQVEPIFAGRAPLSSLSPGALVGAIVALAVSVVALGESFCPPDDPRDLIPTYQVSREKTPNIAENIAMAQEAGSPGAPGNQPLHYEADRQVQRGNREAALAGTGDRPSEFSYDEYPYASTKEGGAGARTALVPVYEQRRQGYELQQFYGQNDLRDADPFYVEVVP